MIRRQECVEKEATPIFRSEVAVENMDVSRFVEQFMNCHLLYHMKRQPQPQGQPIQPREQLALLQHAFLRANEAQNLPRPSLRFNTTHLKQTNNKTLFDTFNYTDFSHNEDEQYSNYLKEYQTLVKGSRKKDQASPQQQANQMNLLIHQFLSDIQHPHNTQKPHKQHKSILPASKQATKIQKVEIDLNAFHIGKSNGKSPNKHQNEASIDKQKKAPTSKLININEMKANLRKNIQPREKSGPKQQIEVIKVTNLGVKPSQHQFQRHIQKVVIAKNPRIPQKAEQRQARGKRESPSQNDSFSYSKSKEAKQAKIKSNQAKKDRHAENGKKPLKIEIQIPLEDFKCEPVSKQEEIKQLQEQRHQIIKDIAHKVTGLLQRTKQIPRQRK